MRKTAPALLAFAALVLALNTGSGSPAEAANCQGRRDTGTAVGAVGGGVVGNAASRGSAGGTIVGAVIGGVAGNLIGGSNCRDSHSARYTPPGITTNTASRSTMIAKAAVTIIAE